NIFAPLNQQPVRKVLVNSLVVTDVFNGAEWQPCCLHCRGGSRNPTRPLIKKACSVRVSESDGCNSCTLELKKNGVFSDDFAHVGIRKTLLVVTEFRRSVDSSQDGSLTRGALRTTCNAETSVRWHHDPVESGRTGRGLV